MSRACYDAFAMLQNLYPPLLSLILMVISEYIFILLHTREHCLSYRLASRTSYLIFVLKVHAVVVSHMASLMAAAAEENTSCEE